MFRQLPPILVGKWAPVCGSVAGELYGVTITPDGRITANDGSEVCFVESVVHSGATPVWRLGGRCTDGARWQRQDELLSLRRVPGGELLLDRTGPACSLRLPANCVHFVLKRC